MQKLWLMALLGALAANAAGPREETFNYEVKWPSGLGLGESQMTATRDGGNWILEFQIEASVPGFRVMDRYRSVVDEKFCTQEFSKEFEHGSRKGKEKTTFANGKAITGSHLAATNAGKSITVKVFPFGTDMVETRTYLAAMQ